MAFVNLALYNGGWMIVGASLPTTIGRDFPTLMKRMSQAGCDSLELFDILPFHLLEDIVLSHEVNDTHHKLLVIFIHANQDGIIEYINDGEKQSIVQY